MKVQFVVFIAQQFTLLALIVFVTWDSLTRKLFEHEIRYQLKLLPEQLAKVSDNRLAKKFVEKLAVQGDSARAYNPLRDCSGHISK